MSRFSWRQRAMTSISFVALHATLAWTQPLSPSAAVVPLVIARGESVTRASCSLIARRDLPGFTLLYFATAARLFEARSGDAPITSVTIARSAGAVAVSPDDVIVATGVAADIGLLRAVVASERAHPLTISFDPPAAGAVFTIVPAHDSGRTSPDGGCMGAVAISAGRAFGVVTECAPGATLVVSPYAAARRFLDRHVRDMFTGSASTGAPR